MPKDGSTKTSEPGITRHKDAHGTLHYRVRVNGVNARTGEPTRVSRNFARFEDARDFKRRTIHELRAGIYQELSAEPVADILTHWLETAELAANSRAAYQGIIDRVLIPAFGAVPLGRLSGRQIQAVYNEPRGTSYAIQVQAVVNGALELAVQEGLIGRNPAAGLRAARRPDTSTAPPIWTPAELAAFLAAIDAHWLADVYHVAVHTGLRLSELVNLRWDDVSLDMARIFVRRSKTTAGVRRVALDRQTVERLRQRQMSQNQRRENAESEWHEHGVVFDRGQGSPVSARTVQEVMARHVKRLGLPHASPHALRHWYASALARAGVPMTLIQQQMGHASFSTTARFYIQYSPADERAAAIAIEHILGPLSGPDGHDMDIRSEPPRKTASE